jgi:hypothetical protein
MNGNMCLGNCGTLLKLEDNLYCHECEPRIENYLNNSEYNTRLIEVERRLKNILLGNERHTDCLIASINDLKSEFKSIKNRLKNVEKQIKNNFNHPEIVEIVTQKILEKRMPTIQETKTTAIDIIHLISEYVLKNNIKELKIKELKSIDLLFFKSIDEFNFTDRVSNCLKAERYEYLGDLVFYDDINNNIPKDARNNFDYIMSLPNLGRKSHKEIIDALATVGITQPIKCPEYFIERVKLYGSEFKGDYF